ncbi:MAG TPA: hypothetical protein VH796_18770 [Nitrososphaeraceae archaeon]|jgi:hypothetical protein
MDKSQQPKQPDGVIAMIIVKNTNPYRSHKDIVEIVPSAAAAKASKFYGCSNSKPGKIIIYPLAHEPDCRFRKKLCSGRFITNSFLTPRECDDGYSLGLAVSS